MSTATRIRPAAAEGLNNVILPDGRTVDWAEAFPRPEHDDPDYWRSTRPDHKED